MLLDGAADRFLPALTTFFHYLQVRLLATSRLRFTFTHKSGYREQRHKHHITGMKLNSKVPLESREVRCEPKSEMDLDISLSFSCLIGGVSKQSSSHI